MCWTPCRGRRLLVVSTPGAEPVAEGGYAAALLLDGWAMLGRPDLRAGEDALRRWIGASALVRAQEAGGTVVVVAEPTLRPVQALVRWDPVGHAVRELGERAELGFPPVSRMAAVSGTGQALAEFLAAAELPAEAELLGPVPLPVTGAAGPRRVGAPPVGEQWERVLVRVPPGRGPRWRLRSRPRRLRGWPGAEGAGARGRSGCGSIPLTSGDGCRWEEGDIGPAVAGRAYARVGPDMRLPSRS